jgi:hypothetical protein
MVIAGGLNIPRPTDVEWLVVDVVHVQPTISDQAERGRRLPGPFGGQAYKKTGGEGKTSACQRRESTGMAGLSY